MSRYRLARQAEADLDEIVDYISVDNPDAALRVLDALQATFRSLASHPGIGQKRDDLRPGLRVFPGGSPAHRYVVCYYSINDGIEIATVIHGSRDWRGLFLRGER